MPKLPSKGGNGSASHDATPPALKTSKFQRFTTREVHRRDLKNADYNPRQITGEAKTRLRDTLNRVGLVQPIVWNERTGNIVGGHQRIKQIDVLEGSDDYRITVAVVDVDELREKELNVLLNNGEVGGDWELEKLGDLLQTEGLDLKNTGFDEAEFLRMFGTAPSQGGGDHQEALNDQLKDVKDAYDKLSKMSASKDDMDFYNVIVFASYDDRRAFLDELGLKDNRYIDGRILTKMLADLRLEQTGHPAELPEG